MYSYIKNWPTPCRKKKPISIPANVSASMPEAAPASAPAAAPEAAPAADETPKDIFAAMATAATKSTAATPDSELLFLGSKGAGKSSVIHSFLQKDEVPKPSTPLEFRFARRAAGGSGATVVANVWELGSGEQFSEMLKVVLLPERLASTVIAIVLDMAEPDSALGTLLQWLDSLSSHINTLVAELNQSETGRAVVAEARKRSEQLWEKHPDKGLVQPLGGLGIPLVILANKWDSFEDAFNEGEYRKIACKGLRYFANLYGGSLICTKHKDKQSMTVLRNLLYHHVFGTASIKSFQMEHTRPLIVSAWSDSFAGIGKAPTVEGVLADTEGEKWRGAWQYMFKAKESKREAQDLTMVEAEQFAEENIDELRRQKRAELMRQRNAAVFEAKMASAGAALTSTGQ